MSVQKTELASVLDEYDRDKGRFRKMFWDSALVSRLKRFLRQGYEDAFGFYKPVDRNNVNWQLFKILCTYRPKHDSKSNQIFLELSKKLFNRDSEVAHNNVADNNVADNNKEILKLYEILSIYPKIVTRENFNSIRKRQNLSVIH